ncbi:MAG: PEP-CTERM system histidine kinase PrsK [Polyangiaceae bacterium]|nr:PEP-CTERM system histidine kinase PrsK [Polyangiaceae bacterium]
MLRSVLTDDGCLSSAFSCAMYGRLAVHVYWLLPSLVAVAAALSLAVYAVLRLPVQRWHVAAIFLSTALVHGAYEAALVAAPIAVGALRIAFAGSILQATFLIAFNVSLTAQLAPSERRGFRSASAPLMMAPVLLLALLIPWGGFHEVRSLGAGWVTPGGLGQLACGGLLIQLVFGIAGLEQLLKRIRDPLHYQVKFLLLGLGLLSVICIYITSSFLLRAVWHPELALAHSSVSVLGLGLSVVGLSRLRVRTRWQGLARVSPASRPISFATAGAFLVAMGIAGTLLPRGSTTSRYVLGVTVASATAVALAVLLASRYVRTVLKRSLSRTFSDSKYDYRREWLAVIEAFHSVASVDAILDRLMDVVGRSFSATRISVWMQLDADRRFRQVRSLNVEEAPPALEASHPLIIAASSSPEVIRVDKASDVDDEFQRATDLRILAPIWGGELLGFVILSDDPRHSAYDQDDVDLLHAVCNHVGLLVAHAQLAVWHRADAEIRALHELSMFCVHDLKNLAGRLSLVVQNAKRFGDNPEFQRSALRTVATTVERMTSLIHKLSARTSSSCALAEGGGDADLFDALASATETVRNGIRLRLPEATDPRPRVRIPKETLTTVLLNVITNAEQALGDEGEIAVQVERTEGQHLVTIADNGPGIEPQALAGLFEPFRSTKRTGLGVGLYQCRRTLEAVGGSILVDSQVGRGTAVKLCLPESIAATEVT